VSEKDDERLRPETLAEEAALAADRAELRAILAELHARRDW